MLNILAYIILGLLILNNVYEFFFSQNERERIYQKTAKDTNFNKGVKSE